MAKKKSFLDIEDVIEPFWRRTSISFAAKNPELVDEWCYERNCGWRPDDFTYASTVKAWWTCPDCRLQYKQVIHQRSWGHGCPYCASQKVSDDNSFAILFPELAKQWHRKKNGKRKPTEFTWGSNSKAWWQCPKGKDHVWEAPIYHRTGSDTEAAGCPFCHSLRTSVTNSLASLYPENMFARAGERS